MSDEPVADQLHNDAKPPVVQRGLWFDEVEVGVTYLHRPGRTMTEMDNVLFSTLTMNPQSLHLDAAWSAHQPGFEGKVLMNSLHTLATMVGMSVAHISRGTTVANLGFRDVTFPAPVFHGDTLYAQTVCLAKRLSASRPGQGIVTLEHVAENQEGIVVARAVRSVMMRTRPQGAGVEQGRD